MDNNGIHYAHIDGEGRLVLPPEFVSRYGLKPDSTVRINDIDSGLNIARSPYNLAKLYIEPTTLCNLDCRTCIRNCWNEPLGRMSGDVFSRIMDGLRDFPAPPTVAFGGFGEPLFHPDIVDMVARAKALGCRVEMVTNGTLLTLEMSRRLLFNGLDMLWVSLDGATPESYGDIRLGSTLSLVLKNLKTFHDAVYEGGLHYLCGIMPRYKTRLGIVFVAMKRNIKELSALIDTGEKLGAEHFLITNVLPYTRDMADEVLYSRTFIDNSYRHLSLKNIEVNETNFGVVYQAMRTIHDTWMFKSPLTMKERCPFIESGAGAVSWDGNLSPCVPLMHSYTGYMSFIDGYGEHFSRRWQLGNVSEHSLSELWNRPDHIAFRERVQAFDFPPCTSCGGCGLVEENEEDCYGNRFPTCGGCLWAQGIIQCP